MSPLKRKTDVTTCHHRLLHLLLDRGHRIETDIGSSLELDYAAAAAAAVMNVDVVDGENENHSTFREHYCYCYYCHALGSVIAVCRPIHLVDGSHKSSHRLLRKSHIADSQGQSLLDPEL